MEIALAIATILGGITALWFFWDKSKKSSSTDNQENQDAFAEVDARLRSIQSPLLPCALFCILRHVLNDEYMIRLFEKRDSNGLELVAMPVPPLPPGTADARVLFPNGYADYRKGIVKEGGIYRLKHPGYNTIHEPISHRFAAVASDSISEANTDFFKPTSIEIEFFFDGKRYSDAKPSLLLASGPSSQTKVVALHVIDNVCYSDLAITGFTNKSTGDSNWSVQDIKNSYFRVIFEFFFVRGVNDIPKESWPTFHNLQIWMGPDVNKVLTFPLDELKEQVVQKNPKPIVSGQARQVQICFEREIDEESYSNNILSNA